MEGEQSPEGCLDVPSSPPKKSKLNSNRFGMPKLQSSSSDVHAFRQASMTHDRGHVMLSQPEQSVLLGAESLVSRVPLKPESTGTGNYARSQLVSYDGSMAADTAAGQMSHADWSSQPAQAAALYPTPQGSSGQWAETGLPPEHSRTSYYPGQLSAPAPYGGQFWDALDGQSRQHPYHTADDYPAESDSLQVSAGPQLSYQDWGADPMALQPVGQNQHQLPLHPATASAPWSIPVARMQQQQQHQPQQHPIRFPSVRDFNAADVHASADSPPGILRRVVSVGHSAQQEPLSPDSQSTESDASVHEEQVMFEGQFEGHTEDTWRADAGQWPSQDVPQLQMMTREADMCVNGGDQSQ